MRGLMSDELKEIYTLERMIQGNISRLCVTDNADEMIRQYANLVHNATRIYDIACRRKK